MKLSIIAQVIGAVLPEGESDAEITSLKSPEQARESDIVFLSNPRFRDEMGKCRARYIIVNKGTVIPDKVCLEVGDPYVAYAKVAQLFEDRSPLFCKSISENALVDPSATIDPSASIGPGSIIGASVKIGPDCRISANCVIERDCKIGSGCRIDSGVIIRYGTVIGDRVVIQSGAVIGSDGFGNAREGTKFVRIPCFGNVVIGDDVDIGANTTIDRGNFAATIIENGVKIDNLVHIAHNVQVGEDSAMAAQVGISGSTVIGKRVIIGGQAGFVGHIEIGDDTFVGAKAGVSKGTEPGSKITGYPARDLMGMRRIEAAQVSLPQLLKDIKQLKNEIQELKKGCCPGT
ncbi:MAG: UDP-3-O-(3-hydroxymyristoyl)glucosamine N-acyltransferase [Fibrobacter sp.]|nr:UDP-3-O-(3-hydroxymyristoyl)glucosamine N-acyltransferase [Fibrobacter sp.]